VRLRDWFFDLSIHQPMQRIVAECLRPEGSLDPRGVSEAHATIDKAYGVLEHPLAGRQWVASTKFSMADCAAVRALFHGAIVHPFTDNFRKARKDFERLVSRPSVKRAIEEARGCFQYFPYRERMPPRFLQG